MTERRMTPDPGAEHDAIVSETYRDIATESAPEHLNRAVLDAAARKARPTYSRLRLWTRPAAWAAVVILSVALILETNQAPIPQSAGPLIEQDAAAPDMRVEPDEKAERQLMKSDLGAADAQELRVEDEDMLQRAEETARMQEGRDDQPPPGPASRAVAVPQEDSSAHAASFAISLEEAPPACDDTARATPESWLECIAELEEAGSLDAARLERELLAEVFPDFDTP
ncbi:MAG: hypothetical protein GTO71_10555 [Woeseiaceae bacterium]|nr:hypothetical protein [Woeseiaceae bacterium]NIP21514.1 hypothetical protein [Woeseiaceae bacterium]NIS90502.1 hypothetical protein [Woeseiaceae bacterium]